MIAKDAHEELYKGYTIKVERDPDPLAPDTNGDRSAFLAGWHQSFWVPPPGRRGSRGASGWEDAWRSTHHIYPIEAYIHSGVVLAPASQGNFPDRAWDVTNPVGFVALSKKEWRSAHSKRATVAVKSLIKEWNGFLSGDVWGYIIERARPRTAMMDSCWGFYGFQYCLEEAKQVVDVYAKEDM